MKIIKYTLRIFVILAIVYSACWYYLAYKITGKISKEYAGKPHHVRALVSGKEYFITFDKASIGGFPFKLSLKIHGWQEESRDAIITYNEPISIGYDLLLQEAYISYNGEIDSSYKPVQSGFGSILKIKNYVIKANITSNWNLISSLRKMKSTVELLNYIRDVNISTGMVQIIDKQEKELFFDKEYETLTFSFVPTKYYKNLQELLTNIPQEYNIIYSSKTNPVKFPSRSIASSFLYGFFPLPSNFSASATLSIKTKAQDIKEFLATSDVKINATILSPFINADSFIIKYNSDLDNSQKKRIKLFTDGEIFLKNGFFEALFTKYNLIRLKILSMIGGPIINREMSYIISNRDAFKFKDLEDNKYLANLNLMFLHNKKSLSVDIDNFSIYSDQSGFKLRHGSNIKFTNPKKTNNKGILLITNYPAISDFISNYIYRFGKFRLLSEEARNFYSDVNKNFLKQISDYPKSKSNDLSFSYEISSKNSRNSFEGKIGNVELKQILDLYNFTFHQHLRSIIKPHGNLYIQIKKALPHLSDSQIRKMSSQIKFPGK